MDNPRYPNRKTHLRARWWDYSKGVFFVTTNTHKGVCCFGDVVQGEMILNDFGRIVQTQWEWLFEQYPYCINHAYVVMPNHFHGLIEIGNVGTGRDPSLHSRRDPSVHSKIKPLSELMGAFKTTHQNKFIWREIWILNGIVHFTTALFAIPGHLKTSGHT